MHEETNITGGWEGATAGIQDDPADDIPDDIALKGAAPYNPPESLGIPVFT
jgi:hypothetical protein